MQSQDTSKGNRLLTAKQVADQLQITEAWVHEQCRQGDMPYVSLGRYRRFRASDIDEWIDSRVTTDQRR